MECVECCGRIGDDGNCVNCGSPGPAVERPKVEPAAPSDDPPEIDQQMLAEAMQGIGALLALLPESALAGTEETPGRVVRAFLEMTLGYGETPEEILSKSFPRAVDAGGYDGPVIQRGVRFTSLCEHHLLPFSGVVCVGYLPDEKVVGISKLARLVECRARRLQLQERLTAEIAGDVMRILGARGAACVIVAGHGCMRCRGVLQPDAELVTSEMLGLFRSDAALRAEFMALARI